ncbi:hypothetical protein BH11PLA1_BH11PLA1_16410 [soil metagenome]
MSRKGRPHRPFYRISAVDARVKRDGAVLEALGWYDPMAGKGEKEMELNLERLKHWLSLGAQPSDTVKSFLAKNKLVDEASWKAEHTGRVESKKKIAEKKAANAASDAASVAKKAEIAKAAS